MKTNFFLQLLLKHYFLETANQPKNLQAFQFSLEAITQHLIYKHLCFPPRHFRRSQKAKKVPRLIILFGPAAKLLSSFCILNLNTSNESLLTMIHGKLTWRQSISFICELFSIIQPWAIYSIPQKIANDTKFLLIMSHTWRESRVFPSSEFSPVWAAQSRWIREKSGRLNKSFCSYLKQFSYKFVSFLAFPSFVVA